MATLGSLVLLAAFVAASYAIASSVAGARRRSPRLIDSGVGAFYLVTALMTVASAIIVHAFVTGNYAIKDVQHYSDSAQPLAYKLASYWGGLDGSIMFWVFLLSVFGAIAVATNRERHRELIPWVVAVISVTEMFFIFLMVVHNNPFETYLTQVPADGRGLNPLLQNFYMAIHPPSLYTGFVAMTIPFAFGIAALVTGHVDDAWLRAVRRWTMVGWLFLTFGLTLGMLWAYEELGWGGYWGWDPVENAGLLPWFTATAFLHSVMVQERRGMLRVWNVTLVIVTFFLTIFGTFMTRSGVVQSVHAFGEDRELAVFFTLFMIAILVVSFGLVIYRLPLLRSRHELDSWVSREAAFLANNWVLLFAAFFVLFATMFPTLSEALTGERLTVGPPFFNKWMLPVGLVLLVLTGVGPLLAWRKSTRSNLVYQFLWPVLFAAAVAVALVALGVRVWSSGVCFALVAFVMGTIAQEFIRGMDVRRSATGTDRLTALVGLVARSRRRYGGYIVHVGIALMFLGFAGEGFKQSATVLLKPGQQTTVGHFTIRHDALSVTSDAQKQMVTGHVSILDDGEPAGGMRPAKWFFNKHEQEPTSEVAIRRAVSEDLYIVLAGYDAQDQTATYAITINPLINWIWFGFGVIAFGTGLALLPERTFAFASARLPAGAATTGLVLVLLLLPVAAGAQDGQARDVAPVPKSALRMQLERDVMCMCGCRAPMNNCPMGQSCRSLPQQSARLDAYLAQGMTRDQVRAAFVADYGGQFVLTAPFDRGFNRLAWVFPYAIGVFGVVVVGLTARRWSRREAPAAPATGGGPGDRELGRGSTMSSATSIDATGLETRQAPGFHAGHFFVLTSLIAATVAVMTTKQATPEGLILISLTVGAAGAAGYGLYRVLAALSGSSTEALAQPLSDRRRATLEREKQLVLRSIKELEFDRAMGKLSTGDFEEMSARLRGRAIALMKQIDAGGSAYRAVIERELSARLAGRPRTPDLKACPPDLKVGPTNAGRAGDDPQIDPVGACASCGTANDVDARFCKACGSRLATAPGPAA